MRVYPKSAEVLGLEIAQALGLGPQHIDVVHRMVVALRAEGEQEGATIRAELKAHEAERAALIEMKNTALRDCRTACEQRDQAARAAHSAAVEACRIVGAWVLGLADEYGAHMLVAQAMSIRNAEPLRDYANGEIDAALFVRVDAMRPADPLPPPPPMRCNYCDAPTSGMVPACVSCGLGDPEETTG